MKYSDFEKHLAGELGRAEAPVQMDSLLSALDLKEKPRRGPFGILTILPFLLLLGGLAYFTTKGSISSLSEGNSSQQYSEKKSTNTKSAIQTSTTKSGIHYSNSTLTQLPETNNSSSITESQTESQNLTINNIQENGLKVSSTIQDDTSSELVNSSLNETKSQRALSELESNNNMSKVVSSVQKTNGSRINGSPDGGRRTSQNSSSSNFPVSTFSSYAPNSNNQSVSKPSFNKTELYSSKLSVEKKTSLNRILGVDLLKNNRSLLEVEKLEEDTDELFSRMKINCPSFNQAYWGIALIPEVGIQAPMKTLALKSGESSPAFDQRSNNEKSLEGFNLGLYGMLVRDKMPFFLKAGLSYTKISERMELEYSVTETTEEFGVIGVTVSENGDSITTIEGPIIVETTYKGKNKRHHYVHLLDLPVSLGYTTYVGGFDLAIEGGVKVNLMTRATGNQLVDQRRYDNLSFSQSFKRKVGLSYFGGLMIGRNFGRFGDFYLAPRFHYYPDDFTSAKNPISQNYITIGINAGVIYKI